MMTLLVFFSLFFVNIVQILSFITESPSSTKILHSEIKTNRNLFFGSASESTTTRTGKVPFQILENLSTKDIKFPFQLELDRGISDDSSEKKTIVIRHLEESDVQIATAMCLTEYGSYASNNPTFSNDVERWADSVSNYIENWLFCFVVSIGLTQRIERRQKGDDQSVPLNPDHNCLVIAELDKDLKEEIVGMAEISIHVPNAGLTSPPFVTPDRIKKLISIITKSAPPCPYISNVLIKDEYRGLSYSKILMAACEGVGKNWGYDCVYLHVDANMVSGATAQGLYKNLGYKPVMNSASGTNERFTRLGPELVNGGLYIVDGVPLLFLSKRI